MNKETAVNTEGIVKSIGAAYAAADELLRLSLFYRAMGMTPKNIPIVPDEQMRSVREMSNENRRGFQMTCKRSKEPDKQLNELSRYPITEELVAAVSEMLSLNKTLDIQASAKSWLFYHQFRLTLGSLIEMRTVNLQDFDIPGQTIDIGEQKNTISSWTNRPTHDEYMWSLMYKVDDVVNVSGHGGTERMDKVLDVAHFIGKGKEIISPIISKQA
jgi:hypothetical protein